MNARGIVISNTITETAYERYLANLLAGDRTHCAQTVQDLVAAGTDLRALYVDLFQRSLYQVGEMWEQQRISVACEHLASAITEHMMSLVQPQAFAGRRERSIVIACVANEYHQLGARMIADVCELRGWRGYFLGVATPLPDLLRAIEEHQPQVLGLSLSIVLNLPILLAAIDAVTQKYPNLPILVGGQAFRWGGIEALRAYPKVCYAASIEELEQRLAAYEC